MRAACCVCEPASAAGFEQIERAEDVGRDEIARPGDGTVHMRFRREVHDVRDGVVLHDLQRRRLVAQIHLCENVFWMRGNFLQILQAPGVSQAVEIDELCDARVVNDVMDKIRADEARAASNEKIHKLNNKDAKTLRFVEIQNALNSMFDENFVEVEHQTERQVHQ